jgi:hypothetical protein
MGIFLNSLKSYLGTTVQVGVDPTTSELTARHSTDELQNLLNSLMSYLGLR